LKLPPVERHRITETNLSSKSNLRAVLRAIEVLGNWRPNGKVSPGHLKVLAANKERDDRVAKLTDKQVEGIYHCDFRDLKIEPGSIDLIATDVLWFEEAAQDWEDLAKLAVKWLKPGGFFTTKIGQLYLDKYLAVFCRHLQYRWIIAAVFDQANPVTDWNGVRTRWRPFIVFSRPGDKCQMDWEDLLYTTREKDWFEWQQPVGEYTAIIKRLCPYKGLVLDPCMGSGTTGVAAHQVGRRFIGCDIDQKKWRIASNRIAEARGK
jgi:hypothetical protein